MRVEECYSELGLRADCSDAEVKAAWRRLAARWHPDRNDSPQALRKIQRINRALEEIQRARQGATEGEPASQPAPDPQPEPRPEAARVLHHTVQLSLEEALAGGARELQGVASEACPDCGGSGCAPAASCGDCGGEGRIRQTLWFPWMQSVLACSACEGRGLVRPPCPACDGSGRKARTYRCRVRIPPGARAGDLLQVPVRGKAGQGSSGLSLCVRIELAPHELFRLDADGTVRVEVPVDGFAWMAQRWIEVPTPSGLQQMKLQRGHLVYRIRGQGFPSRPAGARADCLVTVSPLFPDALSPEQEAQVDRLVALNSGDAATLAGERMAAWRERVGSWRADA